MLDTNMQPGAKMAAVGVAGAGAVVLVWIAGLLGIDMPPEVAAALAVLLNFAAGYFRTEGGSKDEPDDGGGDHVAR
jgi:hypothetical protein